MFTFTSFPIVVTCVPKNTRAFEWSLGITAFRIRFVSTGMAFGSTLVNIWKVQRNSNIGDEMIQFRRALIKLGLDMWPLQLYIFDLSYWQVMTPYSCFFFSSRDCKCGQENRLHPLVERIKHLVRILARQQPSFRSFYGISYCLKQMVSIVRKTKVRNYRRVVSSPSAKFKYLRKW